MCFSSPLSFSTTTSLFLIISLYQYWHILVWVQCGLLKLTDDRLWFSPMMGCSSSVKMGWVLCVVVRWRKRWSSGSSGNVDLAAVVRCVCVFWSALIWVLLNKCVFFNIWVLCIVFWSGLIWVLLNNSVCVFFDGILVEVLLNNCLGFDWVCSRLIWGFFFFFLF